MSEPMTEIKKPTPIGEEAGVIGRLNKILDCDLGDVKIICNGGVLTGLSHILSSASELLSKMLESKFKEGVKKEIDFSKYTLEAVSSFIRYIHVDYDICNTIETRLMFLPYNFTEMLDFIELCEIYDQKKCVKKYVDTLLGCFDHCSGDFYVDLIYYSDKAISVSIETRNKFKIKAYELLLRHPQRIINAYAELLKWSEIDKESEVYLNKINILNDVMKKSNSIKQLYFRKYSYAGVHSIIIFEGVNPDLIEKIFSVKPDRSSISLADYEFAKSSNKCIIVENTDNKFTYVDV
ncbi:MAG: hypothetical protein Hyperionvirus34_5 [Hyperionvirus sp.]|uniref:BTB domain-containing protein n=1 Tax=Hyperionvirus sp. TaxID=2487770 RepID=A0A3G5AEI3_9VIRU|nr:MAG: hypothetical protein Hyperionvirus34_5 [Hyperionvirus sp.]